MYLKTKCHFTSTYGFHNDSLQYCEAFAHSLEWLYDEENFEDERYWLYCMNGVMPIFVLMSILKDIIVLAFDDYAEPNIKDYINRMESDNDKHGRNENEPFIKYEGEYLIIGKVHFFTTEVILWAAYLYFTFRTEINKDYKKAERGRKILYKLYRQKAVVKEKYLKESFLMTHFNQSMVTFVKSIPSNFSESKDNKEKSEMAESVIDKISANNIRFYYEGWRNGKHGSICQQNGIYRFVEQARGKSGMLDDVKRKEEDNPIVAIGIVAYWLQFNSRMDPVIKRLTKYNREIPKDIRELFDGYTIIRFEQFRREHRDDPNTWDWDWEYEFYVNTIIPHEIAFNKKTEALFDYISNSDIILIRNVMNNYINYLKKTRKEKGYNVKPELLVLRAVDSEDETKYEDLEDYEIRAIMEKLKGEGYIDAMWIYGQNKPWVVKLLDKGRVYLKKLEEGEIVPLCNENTSDYLTDNKQAISSSTEADVLNNDDNIKDWDLFKDWILKDVVIEAIKIIPAGEVIGEVKRHFVIHKVLKEIGWLRHNQATRYVGLMKYHKLVDFAAVDFRDNDLKPFKKIKTTEWGSHLTPNSDLGEKYRKFADLVRNTFTRVTNGKLDDLERFYVKGKIRYNQVLIDDSNKK